LQILQPSFEQQGYHALDGLQTVWEARSRALRYSLGAFCGIILINQINYCAGNLNDEQRRWFIDFYKKICRLGDSESKKNKEAEANAQKMVSVRML
jgi:hypothetical protein